MRFTWDPAKNERNIRERGIDFADVTPIFAGPTLIGPDTRHDYPEPRIVCLGAVGGVELVIVYTMPDDETVRIISARRAKRRERKAYRQAFPR